MVNKKSGKNTETVVYNQDRNVQTQGESVSAILSFLDSAMKERKSARLEAINNRLKALEDTGGVDLAALRENEDFLDLVNNAIALSVKTSAVEKIRALQNAIVNAAAGDMPDAITAQVFLNLIDVFTPLHLQILAFFKDPTAWFKNHNQDLPNTTMGSLFSVLFSAFPELRKRKELIEVVWSDLVNAGLHNSAELGTMLGKSGLYTGRTTQLGNEFLDFIAEKSDI